MDEYLEKAEECLKKADEENDISDRYSLLRKAEIYVRMAEIEAREDANIIADKQQDALTSIGVSLKRMDQYITVRTSRR